MGWSRSDGIAGLALLVAALALLLQFLDRGMPFEVQSYVDQTQAANKIVDSVEQVIHARQLAMINVEHNIYEPFWAKQMSLEELNADAKQAMPVVIALGNYKGAFQSNARFFHRQATSDALVGLDKQVDQGVKCFTDLASANHKLSPEQVKGFTEVIAASCAGANVPSSLDALKNAEGVAIAAMDAERADHRDKNTPKPS